MQVTHVLTQKFGAVFASDVRLRRGPNWINWSGSKGGAVCWLFSIRNPGKIDPPLEHMNKGKPGGLVYFFGDEILPNHVGILIDHLINYKDPVVKQQPLGVPEDLNISIFLVLFCHLLRK